jgi:hypothetical protein
MANQVSIGEDESIPSTSSAADSNGLPMDTLQEEEESTSNPSSSGHLHHPRKNSHTNARDVVRNMIGRESKQIFWLRLMAMAVLIVATCLTSFAIFRVSRQAEHDAFESQFHGESTILKDTLLSNVLHMVRSMDNFAIMMTSHAQEQQQQTSSSIWPYQVIPQFEIRGASTKALLGPAVELLLFLPLVTSET